MKSVIIRSARFAVAALFGLSLWGGRPSESRGQTTYTWNSASASLWGTAANWNPNTAAPGSNSNTTNSDIGQFGATGTTTTIQFNFGTIGTPYYVGTIAFLPTNTVVRTAGSNAGTAGTLVLNGSGANNLILDNQSAVSMTIAPTVSSGTGAMTLQLSAANSTINAIGPITVSAAITEGATPSALTKVGTGILNLSGLNTYTGGTTVNAGVLNFQNTNARPITGITTVAATGTLGLGVGGAGFFSSTDIDSLFANTFAGANLDAASGVGIDTTAGSFTYSTSQSGPRSLTKLGTNTLILTGANTYASPTTVAGGTLQIGDGVTDGSITGNIVTNAALSFNLLGTTTFGGNISGTGGVTKTGPGSLTLNGTNSYTGVTSVTGGILILNNAASSVGSLTGSPSSTINGTSVARISAGTLNNGGTAPQLVVGATTFGSLELSGTASINFVHTDNTGAMRLSFRKGYFAQTGGADQHHLQQHRRNCRRFGIHTWQWRHRSWGGIQHRRHRDDQHRLAHRFCPRGRRHADDQRRFRFDDRQHGRLDPHRHRWPGANHSGGRIRLAT